MRELKVAEFDEDFHELYEKAAEELAGVPDSEKFAKAEEIFTRFAGMPEERAFTESQLKQIFELAK